jgi:hypothetical protein
VGELLKTELMERLKRLDEDADLIYGATPGRLVCVIVGGGALILMDYIARATMDIDVIQHSPQLNKLFNKYDFNCMVQAYICNFPYNFEDRFEKVDIETKIIDFYTASLEDIVVAKLCSYRETDAHDVAQPSVLQHIDWEKLDQLAEEERLSALNEYNYNDFKIRYQEYIERFRK